MIKTIEELEEMLELVGQWVRARRMLDDAKAEYGDRFTELREAEQKLSEAVMSVADSDDEQTVQEDAP